MNTFRKPSSWLLGTVSVASLLAGAVLFSQNPLIVRQAAQAAPVVVDSSHAKALSQNFRAVAKVALPAIVSIETRGKVIKLQEDEGADALPFDEDSPFGDLFKNNPQFRELFKRRGGSAVPRMPRSHGMGSGFIIDPNGVIITNNHVVANADQVLVRLEDGTEYKATEWKTDPRSDVAIVRIKPTGQLPFLKLGDSDACDIGDWVLAVGSPFGLQSTVTAGIISAKGRGQGIIEREDFLQTDAAINPGNSGGPLLNLEGEVVGINTAISSRSGGYDGVGFAIPVNMARWVSQQLIEHGTVKRGYLGVVIQPVSNQLAKQFGIKVGSGAIVGQVVPGSPAADAKVEAGDVILTLNGKSVSNPRNLQGIVEQLENGKGYPLEILRNGKKETLTVSIREMPKNLSAAGEEGKSDEPASKNSEPTKPSQFKEFGIEVQEIDTNITEQLGYKGTLKGVLISEVEADSPAENAGLRSGMIIEKVGNKLVSNVAEFTAAMKGLSVEKGILLLVRTPQGTRFIVVSKDE